MKKLLVMLIALAILLPMLASCGNRQWVDLNHTFDKAIIEMPGGEVITVKVKTWRDYDDGEQIQIVSKDGTVYLVNSVNRVLVQD